MKLIAKFDKMKIRIGGNGEQNEQSLKETNEEKQRHQTRKEERKIIS